MAEVNILLVGWAALAVVMALLWLVQYATRNAGIVDVAGAEGVLLVLDGLHVVVVQDVLEGVVLVILDDAVLVGFGGSVVGAVIGPGGGAEAEADRGR